MINIREWNKMTAEELAAERVGFAILLMTHNGNRVHKTVFRNFARATAEAERLELDLIDDAERSGASTWGVTARVFEVEVESW